MFSSENGSCLFWLINHHKRALVTKWDHLKGTSKVFFPKVILSVIILEVSNVPCFRGNDVYLTNFKTVKINKVIFTPCLATLSVTSTACHQHIFNPRMFKFISIMSTLVCRCDAFTLENNCNNLLRKNNHRSSFHSVIGVSSRFDQSGWSCSEPWPLLIVNSMKHS